MSDDLATILKSIASTQASMIKRLEALEAKQNESAGQTDWGTPATSYFLCRPTDPPSKYIQHERGFMWWIYTDVSSTLFEMWPWGLPQNLNWDVGDSIDAFTNAYYYKWGICGIDCYSQTDYWVYENPDEFPLPDEAISDFWGQMTWVSFSLYDQLPALHYDFLMPLCAILFRNDGTLGAPGKVKPVTLSDRDNSSFISRDIRPWFWFYELYP